MCVVTFHDVGNAKLSDNAKPEETTPRVGPRDIRDSDWRAEGAGIRGQYRPGDDVTACFGNVSDIGAQTAKGNGQ